jgi:nucleotide-binding universal stress UspA family protein
MTSVLTILHPTDFSRCADRAFRVACSLARGCRAQVVLLHVLEPVRVSGEWITVELFSPPRQDRWEALRRLRMREPEVPIEPVMRKGAPAEVILDLAREVPCNLIVMGAQGQAAEGASGWGGVAAEVVRTAPCPVITLTVPRPSRPAAPR